MRLNAAVQELQTGLWYWEASHPDWTPGNPDDEGAKVTSYAIDDGERLLLLDPLALPREIDELAADRETAIVLTCAWHERDTRSLAERLDAAVFVPSPEEGDPIEGRRLFSAGDRLPVGVSAFPGKDENDLVLWVESRRALAVGDTLIDRGRGLQIPVDWLSEGVTREQVVAVLRPLLELPVELVLPTHGAPTDRAALEHALS
jgi:glyoxylase-like metal-dependent hydrolase (beta-lactamase superfamily II)